MCPKVTQGESRREEWLWQQSMATRRQKGTGGRTREKKDERESRERARNG